MPDYFGKQTFSNAKGTNTVFYQFNSKQCFDTWQKTDLTVYGDKVDKKLTRQKATKKEFERHQKKQGDIQIFQKFNFPNIPKTESFLHIAHPDEKKANDFGIVVKFDNKEKLNKFLAGEGEVFKPYSKILEQNDARVMAAAASKLFLKHTDQDFMRELKTGLKNYPQLKPGKKHLAMIFQKDPVFSKPEVYSFDSKNMRDKFVERVNKSKRELPIAAGKLGNFHRIAIDHASKGKILEGSMTDAFKRMNEYLKFHNPKDLKPKELEKLDYNILNTRLAVAIKGRYDGQEASPDIVKNLDLRDGTFRKVLDARTERKFDNSLNGLDFSGSSFKGADLSGLDLRGIKGKNIDFSDTNLTGTIFNRAQLETPNFKNAKADSNSPPSFNKANVMGGDFKYTSFKNANFADSTVSRSNFYKSKLDQSFFAGASLNGNQFNQTSLSKADLPDNHALFKGSTFKGADLKGTSLEGSKFDQPMTKAGPSKSM